MSGPVLGEFEISSAARAAAAVDHAALFGGQAAVGRPAVRAAGRAAHDAAVQDVSLDHVFPRNPQLKTSPAPPRGAELLEHADEQAAGGVALELHRDAAQALDGV